MEITAIFELSTIDLLGELLLTSAGTRATFKPLEC